jgi:hypothetical protein
LRPRRRAVKAHLALAGEVGMEASWRQDYRLEIHQKSQENCVENWVFQGHLFTILTVVIARIIGVCD